MKKILIVDGHSVVRAGMKSLVQQNFQQVSIDEAENGETATTRFKESRYDLVILDVTIPETDTISLINYFLTANPGQNILLFTRNSEEFNGRFSEIGIKGFLSKESPDDEIVKAILTVMNGSRYKSGNQD